MIVLGTIPCFDESCYAVERTGYRPGGPWTEGALRPGLGRAPRLPDPGPRCARRAASPRGARRVASDPVSHPPWSGAADAPTKAYPRCSEEPQSITSAMQASAAAAPPAPVDQERLRRRTAVLHPVGPVPGNSAWHPDEIADRAVFMVLEGRLDPQYPAYGALHHYVVAVGAVAPAGLYSLLFDPRLGERRSMGMGFARLHRFCCRRPDISGCA